MIPDTALPTTTFRLETASFNGQPGQAAATGLDLEIMFRPDPTIWDGRFANNGWLQELPKPLTKLTWDNAAMVEPGDRAAALGVRNEDVVELP